MGWFDKKKEVPAPKKVVGVIPSAPALYRFRALQSFWSDAFRSQYTSGSIYTVRQDNNKLANAVANWVSQDKVEII